MSDKPKDFPFTEICLEAERLSKQGHLLFQKWTCDHCGSRQTMSEANHFYTKGLCEECGKETNILTKGCNYLLMSGGPVDPVEFIKKLMEGNRE